MGFLALCLLEGNDTTADCFGEGCYPESAQQCDNRALEISKTLPPLSLVFSSPLFPSLPAVLRAQVKGWNKQPLSCGSCINLIIDNEKQRARELVIPCNSQPCHNQYCIIQLHCLSPKVISSPKELFHSLNLFSFLLFPQGKKKCLLESKRALWKSCPFQIARQWQTRYM